MSRRSSSSVVFCLGGLPAVKSYVNSIGTHGHLGLSHFHHDLVALMGVQGRAARTRSTEIQGERPLHVPGPTRGDGSARAHDPTGVGVLPPGPTLMMIEWVQQLGGWRAGDAHSWGAPPGIVSQARGAISVGSPSFPASSLAGHGGMSPCPPPCLRGWRNIHQLGSSLILKQKISNEDTRTRKCPNLIQCMSFHQSHACKFVLSGRGREGNLSRACCAARSREGGSLQHAVAAPLCSHQPLSSARSPLHARCRAGEKGAFSRRRELSGHSPLLMSMCHPCPPAHALRNSLKTRNLHRFAGVDVRNGLEMVQRP